MTLNPIKRLTAIPTVVWVLTLTFLCLVPFANKAYHIDDTLFIRVAEQIQKHPFDFYGFWMNWFGKTEPIMATFDNPPMTCYYIAFVALVGGWSEPVLHLAFIVPALAAAWGTFWLALRFGSRPFLASTIAVLTPVFVISGTTVMCDMMLLAFWVWSIALFEKALERNNAALYVALCRQRIPHRACILDQIRRARAHPASPCLWHLQKGPWRMVGAHVGSGVVIFGVL